ncbi:MAG: type VI secretion system baseplate subunit TssE [Spirochaetaceae bacterium]|jgi:type VI secretion system lysozyme-like protein|nr:type VI secretion system baseplate subunit TssE [Spirochaetaceae bacterium]
MYPVQNNDGVTKEDARYKPYALKRLTDNDPSEKKERAETLITERQIKEDIFENIDMLFNSRSHAGLKDLKGYEEVENSVLGYGIADFCGRQSSTQSREELRAQIVKQISLFEPRLHAESLAIEQIDTKNSDSSSIEFKIGGVIVSKEVDEEVLFVSKLNLESGNAELRMENN